MRVHRKPPSHDPPPDPQRPWARERFTEHVQVALRWPDRVRVLLHGTVHVAVAVSTAAATGRREVDRSVRVPRLFRAKSGDRGVNPGPR